VVLRVGRSPAGHPASTTAGQGGLVTAKLTSAHVAFNTPLTLEIAAPEPVARGAGLTHVQMQEIAKAAIADGFDEGAIVVLRSKDVYSRRRQYNWGVVHGINRYIAQTEKGFSPLTVRWICDASLTKVWPDDVYLIHKSMNDVVFDERLKGQ